MSIFLTPEHSLNLSYDDEVASYKSASMKFHLSAKSHKSFYIPINGPDFSFSKAEQSKRIEMLEFSKDYLPERYDRFARSNLPIKLVFAAQLICDVAICSLFVTSYGSYLFPITWFSVMHVSLMSFFFIFALFWLNYKLSIILLSLYRLVLDLAPLKRNDKYYSGLEIPDLFVRSQSYPALTIQVPVYKESLGGTISKLVSSLLLLALPSRLVPRSPHPAPLRARGAPIQRGNRRSLQCGGLR